MNLALSKAHGIANKFRAERAGAPKGIVAKRTEGSTSGELYIYAEIGTGFFGEGVTAEGVATALTQLKGVKTLDIYVNSEGGDVFEAKAIYSQLKRFDAVKTAHIDGICASAATFLVMAADKIVTASIATWMVHDPWTVSVGEAADLRATADLLDLQADSIAEIYAAKTLGTVAQMRAVMAAETWMSAQQALDAGFTDEISDGVTSSADTKASTSPLIAAATRTRELIDSVSPAQLLKAKAEMHRLKNLNRPDGSAAQRPAARALTRSPTGTPK